MLWLSAYSDGEMMPIDVLMGGVAQVMLNRSRIWIANVCNCFGIAYGKKQSDAVNEMLGFC